MEMFLLDIFTKREIRLSLDSVVTSYDSIIPFLHKLKYNIIIVLESFSFLSSW